MVSKENHVRRNDLPSYSLFSQFLLSRDNLHVYYQGKLIFNSEEDGIAPLVNYIIRFNSQVEGILVFDRVAGNAAALLLRMASCAEVWSQVGSELAAQTLSNFSINYHFTVTTPYILNRQNNGMCPFEKLSLGKTPEEFYGIISRQLRKTKSL